jgi:excisionase family DNA binding protein
MIDQYLTAEDAADQLGVNVNTIYRLCHARRIRYRKHGKRYLFTREDLTAYLDSCVVEPQEPKARGETRVKLKHLKG